MSVSHEDIEKILSATNIAQVKKYCKDKIIAAVVSCGLYDKESNFDKITVNQMAENIINNNKASYEDVVTKEELLNAINSVTNQQLKFQSELAESQKSFFDKMQCNIGAALSNFSKNSSSTAQNVSQNNRDRSESCPAPNTSSISTSSAPTQKIGISQPVQNCNNVLTNGFDGGLNFDTNFGSSFERNLYEVSIQSQRRFALLHPWVYQLSFCCPKSEVITKLAQLTDTEILRCIARYTATNLTKPEEQQRILLLNYCVSKINFPLAENDLTFKNLVNNIDLAIQSRANFTTQDIDNTYTTMKIDQQATYSKGQHSFRGQNINQHEKYQQQNLCIDFQRNLCQRQDNCRFAHRCEVCHSFGHGSISCRKSAEENFNFI